MLSSRNGVEAKVRIWNRGGTRFEDAVALGLGAQTSLHDECQSATDIYFTAVELQCSATGRGTRFPTGRLYRMFTHERAAIFGLTSSLFYYRASRNLESLRGLESSIINIAGDGVD